MLQVMLDLGFTMMLMVGDPKKDEAGWCKSSSLRVAYNLKLMNCFWNF